MLFLEEMDSAVKRGAEILAEITAYSETCDAYSIMMTEPEGSAMEQMVRNVVLEAALEPDDIDYINAHGTGTQVNDEAEAAMIERVFGSKVRVNATKSLLGHTIGAAGAIEALVAVMSIRENRTHGCRNLDTSVRDLAFITKSESFPIRNALTQSFAFGGHNAALILKKPS